jgi:hypothetical protein
MLSAFWITLNIKDEPNRIPTPKPYKTFCTLQKVADMLRNLDFRPFKSLTKEECYI